MHKIFIFLSLFFVYANARRLNSPNEIIRKVPGLPIQGDLRNATILATLTKYLKNRNAEYGEDYVRKDIFSILHKIFDLMKWQGFIKDQKEPVWSLIDLSFALLGDYTKRKSQHTSYDDECPYSYDQVGELCLAADLSATGLTWHEARLFCQLMKGGDLAIFMDANQFGDITTYARKLDSTYSHAFWIGASSERTGGKFTFINWEKTPLGTPFWGHSGEHQNPSDDKTMAYAYLDPADYYYLDNTGVDAADIAYPIVPLCQYYHGRGHDAHHGYHSSGYYHEGVQKNIAEKLPDIFGASNKGH